MMKIYVTTILMIICMRMSAQEIWQLQPWALDSNYVMGAMASGEPVWVHVDSLGLADSIYLRGDSLILLKNGSGQVYKSRIFNQNGPFYDPIYTDIPNPQKGDIWVADPTYEEYNMYYDGTTWRRLNYYKPGDAGNLSVAPGNIFYNSSRIISFNGLGYSTAHLRGDTILRVSQTDIVNPVIDIKIDTSSLLDLTTQYLNPYVVTGDTVGFYLTVAVDTVLFENTIDTAAYCCPPSFANDTLYIGDNYVELPKENLIGGWGITSTESPAYTWNLIVDSSQVATQYDLSLVSGSQTLTIDSTNRVFTIGISGGNTVKFKDTGGVDSTTVVNVYGTTITESPANQFNITVDSSKFATVYDLSQVSGSTSPISLKISSGNFTRTSTAQQEWTGGNFRDTITSDGYYKIELYASFISSQTTTGGSFAIRNTVTGGTDAIGFLEVSNTISTSTSGVSRITIHNTTSTAVAGTGVTNTTNKHALYGHVTVYLTNGEIITPTFASEDTNSVTYQSGARLIITKLF